MKEKGEGEDEEDGRQLRCTESSCSQSYMVDEMKLGDGRLSRLNQEGSDGEEWMDGSVIQRTGITGCT